MAGSGGRFGIPSNKVYLLMDSLHALMDDEVARIKANEAINHCIEKGLEVVGTSGKHVVLFLVETRYGLPAEKIPEDPDGLVFALRSIFRLGAANLLSSIINELRLHKPGSMAEGLIIEAYAKVLREGQLSIESGIA